MLEGLDGMHLVPKLYKVGLMRRSLAGRKRKKKPDVAAKENKQNDAKKAKTAKKAKKATKATKAPKNPKVDQQEGGPSTAKTTLNSVDLSGMASPPAEQPEDISDMESPAGFKSDEPSPTSLEDSASSSSSGTKRKAEVVVVDEDEDDAVRKQQEGMVLARDLKKQKKSPMVKKKQGSLMGFFSKK